jgi:pimeloyl-ACP methyl ester carboxylesterase
MKIFISFVLFFAFVSANVNAQVEYGNNKKAGHYIKTRGFNTYYEEYGSGEPLILIHNNNGSIKSFEKQIPYFASHYRVIAVDSRAQGKSTDYSDSLTFEMMADDFNALLDSLHLDSTYIIGWSDGGITGLIMAMRYPKKVKKLAVSGPNLWPDTTGLIPFVYHYIEAHSTDLRKQTQTQDVKNKLKISDLDLYEPHITLERLRAIKCPTLVIGGDHDAIPPLHMLQIAQYIPQSYLWIIPNSGHATPKFKADIFNTVINDFFQTPFRKIEGMDVFK